jgi:fibronectin type 3 domain-containing protein
MEGTALTLRAYAPGEYAYAVYGQPIVGTPKPLQTLIDSEVCSFGGGQDDDIPLSYFVGAADYSLGSWRWFGPFGEEDVIVTVNSEMLRSRFKSPNGNFYLCVLASNGGRAASALPDEGLVADFPIERSYRTASNGNDDPGGLKVKEIITWVREHLYTEPAVVTGLSVGASTDGVTLDWDKNPDPEVDIYQIFRAYPDVEDSREHIASVFAPDTNIADSENDPVYPMFNWDVGVPGKEYEYSVRAHNTAGYGGYSIVSGIRLMTAPTVDASDGAFGDHVHIEWTAVEGAEGYSVLRADTADGIPLELSEVGAETPSYDDYSGVVETTYYYWVQALGEDAEGPLGGPDAGLMLELEPVQVTATDGDYPDRVELVWGESDEPLLEHYNVYRNIDESEMGAEQIGVVTPPNHAFTDIAAPWDEPRFYFVKAVVDSVEQPRGVGDWGHRGLGVPGNVTAAQGTFAGKVAVSWGGVNQATRYWVYRSLTPDDPDPAYLDEVEAPTTNYEDTAASWGDTEGVRYFYFVTALCAGPDEERSPLSESAEGWRGIGVPANVSASDGTNTAGVNISWAAVSQATHYRVYRSTVDNDPAPVLLDTVPAPSSGYSDTSAEHATLYWFSVSALYNDDEGARSADDSGYVGLAPPLSVQASDDLEDTIEITWSAVAGATGYTIYRSDTETGTYTELGTDTASPYEDGPFTPPVTYWYKLKATNSLATSAFSSADEGTAGPPEWHIVTVDSAGDVPRYNSLCVVNGNPAISYMYYISWDSDLKYVRASDAYGSAWGTPVTADSAGAVGYWNSLAVVNGNPAISYNDYGPPPPATHENLCKYVRANDADGSSWGTPVFIDPTDRGQFISLAVVNGNPAVSCHSDLSCNLYYARATDANGESWGSWQCLDSDGIVGHWTSLAVVNSNPAISYYDRKNEVVRYKRATDASGSSWGSRVMVDSVPGTCTSLAVVNGNPAISYWDYTNQGLKYVRASDASGGSWGTPLTLDSAGDVGRNPSLAVVNGYPSISYNDLTNDTIKYVQATDANGDNWGTPAVVAYAGDWPEGTYTSLAEVNCYPGISFVEYTGKNLKFAICY